MSLLDLHIDDIVRLHKSVQPFTLSIHSRRFDQHEIETHVQDILAACPSTSAIHWELFMRHELVDIAGNEGKAVIQDANAYYSALCNMLEFILLVTERGLCDDVVIWSAVEDLLRVQTVETCSHVFSWIESRAMRLTTNLDPRKSKGLALLRTLNELLSRLSKSGGATTFCGRILVFLSSVFELGERSGVNLRGDYGPEWDPVSNPPRPVPWEELSPEARQIEQRKEEFFLEFWSFQTPFSRPAKLNTTEAFPAFQTAVNNVLPQLAEANSRERALMGSKALNGTSAAVAAGTTRKRDESQGITPTDRKKEYFFAKFLTSPELLELEIADPQFRRQFLFQLLILLQHLMNFDPKKQADIKKLMPTLQMGGFMLDEAGLKWARDTWMRILDDLRAHAPGGRQFTDIILGILGREQNWIKWKNSSCPSFDKPPLPPAFTATARAKRRKLLEAVVEPQWSHGSAGLTEMWDRGYDDIERAMEASIEIGSLKSFAANNIKINRRLEYRTKMLEKMQQQQPTAVPPVLQAPGASAPASTPGNTSEVSKPPPPKPKIVDPQIKRDEEERMKNSWLALRVARTQHVHVLGASSNQERDSTKDDKENKSSKVPAKLNDPKYIEVLAEAVELEEKKVAETTAKGRGKVSPDLDGPDDDGSRPEATGDVKMEEDGSLQPVKTEDQTMEDGSAH